MQGPIDSVAYQAHISLGADVFMGNFRGNWPRKTANWKHPNTYFDYSVDDYANYDIPAFIDTIMDVKVKELTKLRIIELRK